MYSNVADDSIGLSGAGGGIATDVATLRIFDSQIGPNNGARLTGGIYTYFSDTMIENTTIFENTALFGGGGLRLDGTASLIGVVVRENAVTGEAPNFRAAGGGIDNNAELTIDRSSIINNTAPVGGGITHAGYFNLLTIRNSTIADNSATGGAIPFSDDGGGGILLEGRAEFTNVTLSGNRATAAGGRGGGVFLCGDDCDGNSPYLIAINVTIANNTADAGAGLTVDNCTGQCAGGTPPTRVTGAFLTNTILSNTGGNCSGLPIVSQGHNLSSDASCALSGPGDLANTNAGIGSLGDNGGPTRTHALNSTSAAVDTGDDSACPDTDQRGVVRPQDGDEAGGAVCDIGAFELEGTTPPQEPTPEPQLPPQRPNISGALGSLFVGQPTPLPTAVAAPASGSIRPPNTGDGGLR